MDESGLTCNKIGVSYTAFRMQSRGCDAQRGACLRNQVGDFFDVRGRSSATRPGARSHAPAGGVRVAARQQVPPLGAVPRHGRRGRHRGRGLCGHAGAQAPDPRPPKSLLALTMHDARRPQATPGAANWRLMLESAQTHSTVVTLNIRADDIVWTQNVCVCERAGPVRVRMPHATVQPLRRDLRGDCKQVRAERSRRADHGARAASRFCAPCAALG